MFPIKVFLILSLALLVFSAKMGDAKKLYGDEFKAAQILLTKTLKKFSDSTGTPYTLLKVHWVTKEDTKYFYETDLRTKNGAKGRYKVTLFEKKNASDASIIVKPISR